MEYLDIPFITLIAVAIVGFIALIALFRRPTSNEAGLKGEIEKLTKRIVELEGDLRSALSRADRSEGLAEERRAEIDRLNGDLSKLRLRIDGDQKEQQILKAAVSGLEAKGRGDLEAAENRTAEIKLYKEETTKLRGRVEQEQLGHQVLKATIAGLETQIEADRKAAEDKIALLISVREEMQAKFKQLAEDALKSQGELFSKTNIEKLEATLTPLKEHAGHFEKELREVHQETVKDRERLKVEINQLSKRSEEISTEAIALTRALKGDRQQQQGNRVWDLS